MKQIRVIDCRGIVQVSDVQDSEVEALIAENSTPEKWGEVGSYTIDIVDTTAEVAAKEKLAFALKAQAFGSEMIAFIYTINEGKGLSLEQFQLLMADPTLALIERLLKNGALETAIAVIQSEPVAAYYSAEEIAAVVSKIVEFLVANGKAVPA